MSTPVQTGDFYAFTTDLSLVETTHAGVIVAFTVAEEINLKRLRSAIRSFLNAFSEAETLLLLRPAPRDVAAGDVTAGKIEAELGNLGLKVVVVTFDEKRRLAISGGSGAELFDPERLDEYGETIFQAGLQALFESSATVMRAAPGYHFEAPGGKHLASFIRTGNMFVDSTSTAFVASALLSQLDLLGLRSVATDTSSINALGYALGRLQALYGGTGEISVQSRAKHSGISNRRKPSSSTVVLVSVSFTGEYAAKARKAYPSANVLTLIAIKELKDPSLYLLAPFKRVYSDIDLEAKSWATCEKCLLSNESVVKIAGDQLIPLAPAVRTRLLSKNDALKWMPTYMEALKDLDSTVAYVPLQSSDEAMWGEEATGESGIRPRRAIYFDLVTFFRNAPGRPSDTAAVRALYEDLDEKLQAVVDFAPTHVIHADDASSAQLTSYLISKWRTPPVVLAKRALRARLNDIGEQKSPRILVVTAVSASGRTLAEVSKTLRPLLGRSDVQADYFAFIARADDAPRWAYRSNSVSSGKGSTKRAAVESVLTVWLPTDRSIGESAWTEELDYWTQKQVPWLESLGRGTLGVVESTALPQVQQRIKTLRRGNLKNDLFLGSGADANSAASGEQLRLQGNFMWWSFDYGSKPAPSQATVFMNFAGVLDATRGTERELVPGHVPEPDARFPDTAQHSHNISALHPMNFDRYDDAVTQAALLRGSLRHELDYSGSRSLSSAMLTVLLRVVDDYKAGDESSLVEFMLSLATGRLRLNQWDFRHFLESLPDHLPPIGLVLKKDLASVL